jgi:hypothetical protein
MGDEVHSWLETVMAGYGSKYAKCFHDYGADTMEELHGLDEDDRERLFEILAETQIKELHLRKLKKALARLCKDKGNEGSANVSDGGQTPTTTDPETPPPDPAATMDNAQALRDDIDQETHDRQEKALASLEKLSSKDDQLGALQKKAVLLEEEVTRQAEKTALFEDKVTRQETQDRQKRALASPQATNLATTEKISSKDDQLGALQKKLQQQIDEKEKNAFKGEQEEATSAPPTSAAANPNKQGIGIHCDLNVCMTTNTFTSNLPERIKADALLSTLLPPELMPSFKDKDGFGRFHELFYQPLCKMDAVSQKMALRTDLFYPAVVRERTGLLAKYTRFASLGSTRSALDDARAFTAQGKLALDSGRSSEAIGFYEAAAHLFLLGSKVTYPNLGAAKCLGQLSRIWKNLAPPELLCSTYIWEALRNAHLCRLYCPEYTTGLLRMVEVLEKLVALGADHFSGDLFAYREYTEVMIHSIAECEGKGGVALALFLTGLIDQSDFSRRQQVRKLETLERVRQSGGQAGIACSLVSFMPNVYGIGNSYIDEQKTHLRPFEPVWKIGSQVRVQGLVKAAQHNGKIGLLNARIVPEGRVGVDLGEQGEGQTLSIRKENLELMLTAEEPGQWLTMHITFVHEGKEEMVPAVEFTKVDSVGGNDLDTKRLATPRSLAASKLYIESFVGFVAAIGLFTGGVVLSLGLNDAVQNEAKGFCLRGDLLRRMAQDCSVVPNFNVRLRRPNQRWSAYNGMKLVSHCTSEDEQNNPNVGCDVIPREDDGEAWPEVLDKLVKLCDSSNVAGLAREMLQEFVQEEGRGFDVNTRISDETLLTIIPDEVEMGEISEELAERTLLGLACKGGNHHVVRDMIAMGADPLQRGLLHQCCFSRHRNKREIKQKINRYNVGEIDLSSLQTLMAHGADPDPGASASILPAPEYGRTLEVLLEARTFDLSANEILVDKIAHKMQMGSTPLHTLFGVWPPKKEIDLSSLQTLLVHGADPNGMFAAERWEDEHDTNGLMSVLDAVCKEGPKFFDLTRAVACEKLLDRGGCFTRPINALRTIYQAGDYVKIAKAIMGDEASLPRAIYDQEASKDYEYALLPYLDACAHGRTGLVMYFLSTGFDLYGENAIDAPACIREQPWWPALEHLDSCKWGLTCIDAAAVTGNIDVLRLFLAMYEPKHRAEHVEESWDLVRKATVAGAHNVVSFLRELVASNGVRMCSSSSVAIANGEGKGGNAAAFSVAIGLNRISKRQGPAGGIMTLGKPTMLRILGFLSRRFNGLEGLFRISCTESIDFEGRDCALVLKDLMASSNANMKWRAPKLNKQRSFEGNGVPPNYSPHSFPQDSANDAVADNDELFLDVDGDSSSVVGGSKRKKKKKRKKRK